MNPRRVALSLAAALVLSGGLLIGLSTGAASAGHAAKSTTTVVTVPDPVVTTVTRPALPTSDLPGAGRTVRVGDMNTPEQFIIGQLYALALAQQGYKVIVYRNVGLLSQGVGGLRDGSLDIYPEYLGVWNGAEAHLHHRFHSLRASYGAARAYARRHGFKLLPPTPFSDTSCVAVLSQYAQANHVYSISQLAQRGPIIFGAPTDFQDSADGVPALEHSYHLHPDYVQSIGVSLQYWWLNSGNVEAAYCSTTDPELSQPRYLQLRDPKNIFGYGNVVPVTTPHVLHVEGKTFARTIERVDALLTQRAVRGLNAEDQMGGHSPTAIAEQFLEGNGVLPPARYAPVPTTTTTTTSTAG